jgi:hypothetical protein
MDAHFISVNELTKTKIKKKIEELFLYGSNESTKNPPAEGNVSQTAGNEGAS